MNSKNIKFALQLIIVIVLGITFGAILRYYIVHASQDKPTPTLEPMPIQVSVEVEKEPETQELTSQEYTQKDIELIARVVYAEARGECSEGQQAIVQVIMNRVYSSEYPNTIQEVIRQQGQFVIGNTYTEKELRNVTYTLEHGYELLKHEMYFGTWAFREGDNVKIGKHYFMR